MRGALIGALWAFLIPVCFGQEVPSALREEVLRGDPGTDRELRRFLESDRGDSQWLRTFGAVADLYRKSGSGSQLLLAAEALLPAASETDPIRLAAGLLARDQKCLARSDRYLRSIAPLSTHVHSALGYLAGLRFDHPTAAAQFRSAKDPSAASYHDRIQADLDRSAARQFLLLSFLPVAFPTLLWFTLRHLRSGP